MLSIFDCRKTLKEFVEFCDRVSHEDTWVFDRQETLTLLILSGAPPEELNEVENSPWIEFPFAGERVQKLMKSVHETLKQNRNLPYNKAFFDAASELKSMAGFSVIREVATPQDKPSAASSTTPVTFETTEMKDLPESGEVTITITL
jgi:hypothetical protein